jgi:nitrogen fixation NifU-like protein
MDFGDMYREIILDHYRHPQNAGLREPFDAQVYSVYGDGYDEVTLRVALSDAGREPVIADVSYQALGCSIHQASTSIMTDLVIGKTVAEAMAISEAFLDLMRSHGTAEPDEDTLADAVALAGVSKYPARVKCALLGWMAWKQATTQALGQRD